MLFHSKIKVKHTTWVSLIKCNQEEPEGEKNESVRHSWPHWCEWVQFQYVLLCKGTLYLGIPTLIFKRILYICLMVKSWFVWDRAQLIWRQRVMGLEEEIEASATKRLVFHEQPFFYATSSRFGDTANRTRILNHGTTTKAQFETTLRAARTVLILLLFGGSYFYPDM